MTATMERFTTSWHPLDFVKIECAKRGMKEGDNTSFWDWMRPEDCESFSTSNTFASAKAEAISVRPFDCFGAPRVEHWEWVGGKRSGYWERTRMWEIHGDDAREDDPDYEGSL